jgi:hypothetical protein
MANALTSRAERFEKGKSLRDHAPRETHADLNGPLHRDAVAILAESDANRVPELLPERLVASVAVAAKAASLSNKRARSLAADTVAAYREHMFALMELSPLEVWHSRIDLEQKLKLVKSEDLRRNLSALIARARSTGLEKDDNFPHLVTGVEPKIADKPPTIFHFDPKADSRHKIDARRAFELYRESVSPDRRILLDRYQLKDFAFKAVGVGSVGAFCCVGLFLSEDKEPLFLQVKEAQNSVLERLGGAVAYRGAHGRRVVEGQRVMQAASDIFLGWTSDEASGRQFYVRILKNHRLGAVSKISEQKALSGYSRLCGWTLARAHARSGDPATIAGYIGRGQIFDDALSSFALAYADQTIIDHAALVKAESRSARKPSPSK